MKSIVALIVGVSLLIFGLTAPLWGAKPNIPEWITGENPVVKSGCNSTCACNPCQCKTCACVSNK